MKRLVRLKKFRVKVPLQLIPQTRYAHTCLVYIEFERFSVRCFSNHTDSRKWSLVLQQTNIAKLAQVKLPVRAADNSYIRYYVTATNTCYITELDTCSEQEKRPIQQRKAMKIKGSHHA